MSGKVYCIIEIDASEQAHGGRISAAMEMAQTLAWASGLRPGNSASIGHEF